MKLTHERLRKVFAYDKTKGLFYYKIKTNRSVKIGQAAGWVNEHNGYRYVSIDGEVFLYARLVWFYVYGHFPENDIDHINRIRHDNRIKNLRKVNRRSNLKNSKVPITNSSGVKGVGWFKKSKKWRASIMVNQKDHHLGLYKNFHNAVCARLAAEQCLGWDKYDSKSSAFSYVEKMIK
ncbi:MAG: HNH endonuclease [Halobacteriota archaeon]|nr:HNH endonuclease [Halobacteriota archaeon]